MRKALRSVHGVFVVALLATSGAAIALAAGPSKAKDAKTQPAEGDAPQVASLTTMLEGFKWGQSPQDVVNAHNAVGGILDKDFDPQLARVQPGVQQKALESDRDNRKAAFQRSFIEFKDVPTGYDATMLRTEYSYKNRESLLTIDRAGRKRYFFFIGSPARLWKIYDEVPLDETSPLGATYKEGVTKMQSVLGVAGRVRAADPSKGIVTTTVDWQDASTHLRLLDRGRIAAIVVEERQTLANLDRLRSVKAEDPLALDHSIIAVTKSGATDPNAKPPAASASASTGRRGGPSR